MELCARHFNLLDLSKQGWQQGVGGREQLEVKQGVSPGCGGRPAVPADHLPGGAVLCRGCLCQETSEGLKGTACPLAFLVGPACLSRSSLAGSVKFGYKPLQSCADLHLKQFYLKIIYLNRRFSERERGIILLLVHSPDCCSGPGWTRLQQEL